MLRGGDRSWVVSRARKLIAYVLVRRMGYRLNDVAAYFRRDAATIGTLLSRMTGQTAVEPQEKRAIERLEKLVTS